MKLHEKIRCALAANPSLTHDIMDKLAHDSLFTDNEDHPNDPENHIVRYALSKNSSLTAEATDMLAREDAYNNSINQIKEE